MKQVILLFTFLYTTAAFSQLVMESSFSVAGDLGEASSFSQSFDITNSGADAANYYWSLERSAGLPRAWEFTVCDAVLCHAEGVESTPCGDASFINVLSSGQTIGYNKITLNSKGVAGEHSIKFKLSSVCDNFEGANLLAETEITFSVTGESSIDDNELVGNPIVYPNPTVDRFQVKNDNDVVNVSLFNIVGKRLLTEAHTAGQAHDVSNLDKGIYLVRMLDKNDQTLKVIRLTKD